MRGTNGGLGRYCRMAASALALGVVGCSGGGGGSPQQIPLDAAVSTDAAHDVDATNPPPVLPACSNGLDDDGDGKVDHPADPGCDSADDTDETDPPAIPACNNGLDDDGDGKVDTDDPGCANAADPNEGDEPVIPACANNVDDDADGYTDYPDDPGCGSAQDDDETDSGAVLPQCGNGVDDDRDGLIDLADPGCTSPADPREATQPEDEIPACSNGLDDDGDGAIDFPLEPGCAAAGDQDETDPPNPPPCADGRDNDDDGAVDFPDDPGCQGVGDRDEADPATAPACHDGLDNDRDGQIDYPNDRGCTSAADGSEAGSCGEAYDPVDLAPGVPQTGDNRGAHFREEGSCGGRGAAEVVYGYRVTHTLEALIITVAPSPNADRSLESTIYVRRQCLDGGTEVGCAREAVDDGMVGNTLRLDQPAAGDYSIFIDGANGVGGAFIVTAEEVPLAQCLNGEDDDGDGRVDYPVDPGCDSAQDRDETDDGLRQCANDLDDDGDGLVDYPIDLGCESAADDDEVDVCGQGVRVIEFPADADSVSGDTTGGTNVFSGSCVPGNGAERVVHYHNWINARLTFSVDNEDTLPNTGLYIRTVCSDPHSELPNGCSIGALGGGTRGVVRIDRAGAGDYFLVVDHTFGQGGPFKLTVTSQRLPPGCSDGADSDGDGLVDGDDPGCESAEDEDEHDPPAGAPAPVCNNGADDDGDGYIDYPFDPGCATKGDPDETEPVGVQPACANGVDDDGDGKTDFPLDPGCQSRGDDAERNPVPPPACGDSIDQDQDGKIDYPFDPGCDAAGDPSEQDPDVQPACNDGADNDRDGLVDFPFDPGCAAASDRDEADEAVAPLCHNGQDDDGDGRTDYPLDPGCRYAADPDETDPNFPPACANLRDDDGDGRIDYPDDIGCVAAWDTDETNQGGARERCRNGLDDDGDGAVDLADVGCSGPKDNDEADPGPDAVPACANGQDDDGDGLTDWPADDGCAAHGAECEQAGYGLCDGVCIDLVGDANNCGRCGHACNPGVECLAGVCGGLTTFEGVQQNVDENTLGGWDVCHHDTYADNTPIAPILQACAGDWILYGCRPVGSPTFALMAMGERASVLANTGDQNNNVNTTNGVSFYFSENYSMGFVPAGAVPQRNSCDTGADQGDLRMCWHTGGQALNSGYRCGNTFLNGDGGWERVIFTSR